MKRADKYVIGLTGSIGTGKSVVRRLLEHLGAFGIDADALAHRVISRGAPGYQLVLDRFGSELLDKHLEIDRKKLAQVVFKNPQALDDLEMIVHPLVIQAVDLLIERAPQKVIVIEAIKLLEAGMAESCDAVWVTYTSPEVQLIRLMDYRGMEENDASLRITSQLSQESRFPRASVIINNDGTILETWQQVQAAWKRDIAVQEDAITRSLRRERLAGGECFFERAHPGQEEDIAAALTRLNKDGRVFTATDVIHAFGEKGFLLLWIENEIKGLLGWRPENLVSRTTDIHLEDAFADQYLPALIQEMERRAEQYQCEISLVLIASNQSGRVSVLTNLGYGKVQPGVLEMSAWREAARDSFQPGLAILSKRLRQELLLIAN